MTTKQPFDDFSLLIGNELMAEVAIRAGCRYYFGYPITPQNEITAYMARRMPQVEGVFIQTESELAAVNMAMGAAIAGKRVMTSSSSPGMSLKQEGISYLAGCELPALIIDVMRGGPGLGSIGPSQADYFQATRGGGHGDYRLIVYGPTYFDDMVRVIYSSFDKAEKYRIPVLVICDGIMGQMMEKASLPAFKNLSPKKHSWTLDGCRGREPRKVHSLYLDVQDLLVHNKKLQKKYARIEQKETQWTEWGTEDADLVVVSYGSPARLAEYVIRQRRKQNRKVGFFRPLTLWPFPGERIRALSEKINRFLVIEMNEGQMVEDIQRFSRSDTDIKFWGKSGGVIIHQHEIEQKIDEYL